MTVRVRFQRGDVVVELDGDDTVVQELLSGYGRNGYGKILEFFDGPVPLAAAGQRPISTPLTRPARTLRFAVDYVSVPISSQEHAVDLSGDGRPDNQFGNVVTALVSQNIGPGQRVAQGPGGQPTMLVELATSDVALGVDQRADVTLRAGTADPAGTGMIIDPAVPPVRILGYLIGGRFSNPAAVAGAEPPVVQVAVALLPGITIRLPIHATRVSFAVALTGTNLTDGHFHGAVVAYDVTNTLAPAFARWMTAQIQADPTSRTAQQISQLFDKGRCVNPDGTRAQAADGVIDTCEFTSNQVVQNVLTPDVRLYDSTGRFAPSGNPPKDSLTIGFGFTAAGYT